MKKAPFIVLEGGEGAGKSTQIENLRKAYPDAHFTREPGGSVYGDEIRSVLLDSPHAEGAPALTKLLLFFANRADHITRTILPSLEKGRMVITDRFDASSYAYQLYGQESKELTDLYFILRKEVVSMCPPDLYIYFEIIPEEGLKRKAIQAKEEKKKLNYFDETNIEFHKRMRVGYEDFFKVVSEPMERIDALRPTEEVSRKTITIIEKVLKNFRS